MSIAIFEKEKDNRNGYIIRKQMVIGAEEDHGRDFMTRSVVSFPKKESKIF